MPEHLSQSDPTALAVKWALEAGMNAFRRELEDENQHLDDAVRTGILVAIKDYADRTES